MKLYTHAVDYLRAHPAATGFLGGGSTLAVIDWEHSAEVANKIRAFSSTVVVVCSFILILPQLFDLFTQGRRALARWADRRFVAALFRLRLGRRQQRRAARRQARPLKLYGKPKRVPPVRKKGRLRG